MFEKGVISKHVWILELYYVLSYLIINSVHYIVIKYHLETWNLGKRMWVSQDSDIIRVELILLVLILIITSLFILFFIPPYYKRRNSKVYVYIVPIFVFLTSYFSIFITGEGLNFGDLGFISEVSFFMFIFLLVLSYDNTPTNPKALELMHHRYLQFLYSIVWLIIFGGTWIIAFLLQQVPTNKTDMFIFAFVVGAIQNLFISGAGLILIVYAFNERLRDIEHRLDSSHREN